MPLHWTISHSSRLVLAFAKVTVQPAEVHRYFDALSARPYRKIFNVTHMQDGFSDLALADFAATMKAYAATGWARRTIPPASLRFWRAELPIS